MGRRRAIPPSAGCRLQAARRASSFLQAPHHQTRQLWQQQQLAVQSYAMYSIPTRVMQAVGICVCYLIPLHPSLRARLDAAIRTAQQVRVGMSCRVLARARQGPGPRSPQDLIGTSQSAAVWSGARLPGELVRPWRSAALVQPSRLSVCVSEEIAGCARRLTTEIQSM